MNWEREEDRKCISGGWLFFLILWGILGYFVYNSTAGALAIMLLWMLYGVSLIISLVPFVGVFAQAAIMYFVIWPAVSGFTGLQESWLTTVLFWMAVIIGGLLTLLTTAFVKK